MDEIKKRALELVALLEAEHHKLPEGDQKDVLALAWYGLNLIDEMQKGHPHCIIGCLGTMGDIARQLDASLVTQLNPGERLALLLEEITKRRELPEEDFIEVSNAIPV